VGYFSHKNIVFNNRLVTSFSRVTEFNFAYSECVQPGHLEQLAIACPNIQRLNLQDNCECLVRLQGLRTIAINCHDLCGLNIQHVSVTKIEDHLGLW